MRVGILTFHRAHNCGAMLQAWALKTVLERMGHVVEFPNCNHVGLPPRWCLRNSIAFATGYRKILSAGKALLVDTRSVVWNPIYNANERFRKTHLAGPDISANKLSSMYDKIIVGSDQVFNPTITNLETDLFLGEGAAKKVPYIAYAGSLGDVDLLPKQFARLTAALRDFKAVSFREARAAVLVAAALGKDVPEVLDPTFLLDRGEYLKVFPVYKGKRPYVFVYALRLTPFVQRLIRIASEFTGMDVICSSAYDYQLGRRLGLNMVPISPDRLVSYIAGSTAVLASSFHGTALSVVFNKPFLSARESMEREGSRSMNLLRNICMENRLVTPMNREDDMMPLLMSQFNILNGRLNVLRDSSMEFLENALE